MTSTSMYRIESYATRRGGARSIAGALAAVMALLLAAAPASSQSATLSLRLGVAGGGGVPTPTLVPGIEYRGAGVVHLLAGIDVYLPNAGQRSDFAMPPDTARTEVTRTSLSPPRLRAGIGWNAPLEAAQLEFRAFAGQQGVVEGFHPLIGGGAVMGAGGWGLGVEAALHRGTVYERVGLPENQGLITETALRRTWAPRWELSARSDLGGVPRDIGRPVLAGAAAGAVGGLLGGLAGVILADCSGESCVPPFIVGAVIGETLGLPMGVHLAEGRRRNLARSTLASFGIAAVGVAAMAIMPGSDIAHQGVAVLVPVGQLIASLAIERRTAGLR